ncbi:hypothetical protein FGIG_08930 [Fasciola gigantica]|uniref:Uncharacterized protein n=1 Tax=Fasciola gigantica TaxID=46835 RepID=A0A504Z902_FASGI|nr:hypothetical protein FGIG_08930 [Fasciola gigantica]
MPGGVGIIQKSRANVAMPKSRHKKSMDTMMTPKNHTKLSSDSSPSFSDETAFLPEESSSADGCCCCR